LKYDCANQRVNFGLDHSGGSFSARSTDGVIGLNEFKHVAVVWDPSAGATGEIRGYVNGVLVLQAAAPDYWDDSPVCGWNLMIGGRNLPDNPWTFIGQIDELRWSNYALEPSEFLNASN
jgi:hypothetical protein